MPGYEKSENSNGVKSLMKAFLIMEELDKAWELSISNLNERLLIDKVTVHRLINTMKDAGYINQNPANKKYSNSFKLLAMGNKVMEKTGIRHIARSFIEELAEKTGETINLGVRVGGNIIYLDKIESSSTIKVGISIGTSVPGYCTGMGKAVFAFMPEDELNQVVKNIKYEKFTLNTAEGLLELQEKLKRIRREGYSMDEEEYVEGLISFGAPIFDFHRSPIAAISISCPKYRYDDNRHRPLYSQLVMDAAGRISKQLGYQSV